MRVRFLGTGAAGGWPNPFCQCESCSIERADGRSRSTTSLLVDDTILLDCGPAALEGTRRLGQSLAPVEHVVVTHGHPDHLAPELFLIRRWADSARPLATGALHLWAPPVALDVCRPWLAPSDIEVTVHLHALVPGQQHRLVTAHGDYTLRTLPANHNARPPDGDALAAEAVLIDLESAQGTRVLYATDTGPLPADALELMSGRDYTLACIEETFGDHTDHRTGHLDLHTFPQVLSTLHSIGALTTSSQVVAIHLGHHNPPTPKLRARLEPMGVQIVDDGTILLLHEDPSPQKGQGPTMTRGGSTHLIVGGARSGKSTYAEHLARDHSSVTYVACARLYPGDEEWAARIQAHRDRRPADWQTQETAEIAAVIAHDQGEPAGQSCVLVDCLGTWVTALVDDAAAWDDRQRATSVVQEACAELIEALETTRSHVILVSNEVGSGVVPDTASGRIFRDLLGLVNLRVGAACDQVTAMIAGQPLPLIHERRTTVEASSAASPERSAHR